MNIYLEDFDGCFYLLTSEIPEREWDYVDEQFLAISLGWGMSVSL